MVTGATPTIPYGGANGNPAPTTERPSNLSYTASETPPASVGFACAWQGIAVMAGASLPFPILIGQAAGLAPHAMLDFLSLSFFAMGIGTLLQSLAGRYFGCGYLVAFAFAAAYLLPSVQALRLGGLPLLCGMTLCGGIAELLLAQIVPRLRPFFPVEVAGVCVTEIGFLLGVLGLRLVLGIGGLSHRGPGGADTAWGIATLALIVSLQVWAKGVFRMLAVIIGMIIGVLAGFALGLYDIGPIAALAGGAFIRLPAWPGLHLSFRGELLIPFLFGATACCLRATGDITMSQKINDRAWIRPDMANIRKGIMTDGFNTMISALLGSVGGNTSSSMVAVASASGIASRVVGFWVGGLLIALAMFPVIVGFFAFLPDPVMGAALVFIACFVLLNGMQIITSRLLDARRVLVIGLSLTLSLSRDIFPAYYRSLPHFFQPFVSSDLVVALLTAMILNAIFRVGMKKRQSLTITPGVDAPASVRAFFDEIGAKWGARRDIVDRAAFGCDQAIEIIADYCDLRGPIVIEARFDEFRLDVSLLYDGATPELSAERPSAEEIIENADNVLRLGGYLLRRNADRVHATRRPRAPRVSFPALSPATKWSPQFLQTRRHPGGGPDARAPLNLRSVMGQIAQPVGAGKEHPDLLFAEALPVEGHLNGEIQ